MTEPVSTASDGFHPPRGSSGRAPRAFDRPFWLALAVAALVLLPRAVLIARAHSECYDDEYHLVRGALFLTRGLAGMAQTDPPLGEGLSALPAVLTNRSRAWSGSLYDHSLRPETTLLLVALWRTVLFLPAVAVAFQWCRTIYGLRAAWLAQALLLVEPTFAAHIPLASLDALGVVGAVLGSYAAWRYFEKPGYGRLAAAGFLMAFALLLKHTTVVLPLVVLGYAALWWGVGPWLGRAGPAAAPGTAGERRRPEWGRRAAHLALGAVIVPVSIWALTLFDVSRPDIPPDVQESGGLLFRLLDRPLPAGLYIGSILHAEWHADQGHPAYLLGEKRQAGWWYYFPLVATYKVPLGILFVMLLAILSLRRRRPRFEEWGLALPMAVWTTLMLATRINIGFRHFLPAYVFMLLLSARCLADPGPGEDDAAARPGAGKAWSIAAWTAVAAAGLHALSYHPDYIAYMNFPRDRPYLAVSDSNVDWGQGLKQVRRWAEANKQPGLPIYLLYFGDDNSPQRIEHYVGGGLVTTLPRRALLPRYGLLIASPVWVAGPFDRSDLYAALRAERPIDVIGHSLLVFDLSRLAGT